MKRPFRRQSKSPTAAGEANVTKAQATVAQTVAATTEQQPPNTPSVGKRGQLRRRLRYLRQAHELGLRDLGGLIFELHRFQRSNDELVRAKLHALEIVDNELHAIERALSAPRTMTELHEPGISACRRCGALHGSEARFCPNCGLEFDAAAYQIAPLIVGGEASHDQATLFPLPTPRPTPTGGAPTPSDDLK